MHDYGKEWTLRGHGDLRTATPPTERERWSGAVCSTLTTCAAPNVLVQISQDLNYVRYVGQCTHCGRNFYAVENRV